METKKAAEIDADRPNTPKPANEENAVASPRPNEEEEPVALAAVEEAFERPHASLAAAPAVNGDDNITNSTRIAFVG